VNDQSGSITPLTANAMTTVAENQMAGVSFNADFKPKL
jgi:hypothetical protein